MAWHYSGAAASNPERKFKCVTGLVSSQNCPLCRRIRVKMIGFVILRILLTSRLNRPTRKRAIVAWNSITSNSFYSHWSCLCCNKKKARLGRWEGRDLKVKQNNRASSELAVLLRLTNQPCLTRGQECARWSPACVHDICLMQTGTSLFRIIQSHHVQLITSRFQ